MVGTVDSFTSERAPCGQMVAGERSVEDDHEGLVIDTVTYTCGCQRVREQYHDGSIEIRVTHHGGRVLSDEHSAAHEG